MIGFLKRLRHRLPLPGRRPDVRVIAESSWFRIEHHPDRLINKVELHFTWGPWATLPPVPMSEGDADELSEALYLAGPPLLPPEYP